jgi:hypothetical protein
MSARCRGLNEVPGNDRRQAQAKLLGGGLAGAPLGAPRQVFWGRDIDGAPFRRRTLYSDGHRRGGVEESVL